MPTQIIAELKEDNTTVGILTNMSTADDSIYTYEHTDSWGFAFDSFDGANTRVGITVDSGGIPSVFYVGTDGYLRRFNSDSQGHWHEADSQDDSKWPATTTKSDDFGIAYDDTGNRIWIYYYISEDNMAQVYQSGTNTWSSFTTLSKSSDSDDSSSSSSSGSSSGSSSNSTSSTGTTSGLTSDAKVGLGVGLGLGIPLVAAALALCFLIRRRKQSRIAKKHQLESQYMQHLHNGSNSPNSTHSANSPVTPTTATTLSGPDQNQGYWQDGMWIEKTATTYYAGGPGASHLHREQLGELPTKPPVFEMPGQGVAHEMSAAGEHR